MTITVRFAPSPTGRIHIGNARTAILNWLFAHKAGGRFILRYDDTDIERSTRVFADGIATDLDWLGLTPDEVFRQSERFALYDAAAERLKQDGRLYACYETAEELDYKRKRQLARHQPPVYDRSGLTLVTAAVRRIPPDCLDQKIHSCNLLNSILAKIEANAAGADDAMMLDTQGFVAETNATHLFFVIDGVLTTPYTHSCPEGVTREAVLSLCEREGIAARVADISLAEVYRSEEVFCTGTMGELAAITQIDGRVVGKGEAGPLCARLSGLYGELTHTEGESP